MEKKNHNSNKNDTNNTNLPIDKRYPESYIYKTPKSIEFLKNYNFKKKKD